MPKIGQQYKHKQIKDMVYVIVAVHTEQRYAVLKADRSKTVTVTFKQLDQSYRRIS